jgi:hypothetical protein
MRVTLDRIADDAVRRTVRRAAGGYFALLFVLLVGAIAYQATVNRKLDAANARLQRAEIRACERLQAQRERTNVSEARQYLLLEAVAASPRATKKVKDEYKALASTTLYDPPTDCVAAVKRPVAYERPPSVPYSSLPVFAERVVMAAKAKRPQPIP